MKEKKCSGLSILSRALCPLQYIIHMTNMTLSRKMKKGTLK